MLAATLVVAGSTAWAARHAGAYSTQGDCRGLPRLRLDVAKEFCIGMVAQGLGVPRGVLPMADGSVLVVDQGGWARGKGRVLRLTTVDGGSYRSAVLLRGLNRPHGLQLGPDGWVYVGEDDRIARFDPKASTPALAAVIDGLPSAGEHPLKSFVFTADGALIVNLGAPTDNCADEKGKPVCADATGAKAQGALWRFTSKDGTWSGAPYATGLRNSIALTVDPANGALWQADNSRDGIKAAMGRNEPDDDLPHDELNLVVAGGNYGWPYCYDDGIAGPEFPAADCSRYRRPVLLLPPHSAPLGLVFYRSEAAPPAWRDVLLITLHGYRSTGHRIVGLALTAAGQPTGRLLPLVSGWDGKAGTSPMGAPTDIKADARGDLWVTDDRNGALLRISPVGVPANSTPR